MLNILKRILAFSLLVILSQYVFGQDVKSLDLTSKADASKYFVVLCGRNNSLTGHAFIIWAKEDAVARQSVVEGAFGLYPQGAGNSSGASSGTIQSVFMKVPGEIADEFYKGSLRQDLIRLIVQVDKSVYDKTFAIKNTWEGRNNYQLIENDCVTFATEVAKGLALTIPVRNTTDRPWNYIDKFLSSNNQTDFLFGDWESSDPAKRFKLGIAESTCTWTERAAGGATIVRTVPVVPENGAYKVYRANDNDVLVFLGFQNTIRAQILARGAKASFIVIKRIDATHLQGQWNGLVIVKDASAGLREIKQPGTTPARQFDFARTY